MTDLIKDEDYRNWIVSIKNRVQASQIKAAVAVNYAMLELYWFLGEQIVERQETAKWGDGVLTQMSKDLTAEFPDLTGFSRRNLFYMRKWVRFWQGGSEKVQQLAAPELTKVQQVAAQLPESAKSHVLQVPWGHHLVLLDKLSNPEEALFYVQKTIENNWSRAFLRHQIESGLYRREGNAINNFATTLPEPESDLARQLLRDPYNFDFLMLTERHNERELEDGLLEHLTKFLLELGAGFAFVGRQYRIEVDGDEFFIEPVKIFVSA